LNTISRVMASLGIDYNPAMMSTESMLARIRELNTAILGLQRTAATGVRLPGGVTGATGGAAQSADTVQRLAYAERARAQAALTDAKAQQAANAPLLDQSKQRINLAREESILQGARGRYIRDVAQAMRTDATRHIIDSRALINTARQQLLVTRAQGQALRDNATAAGTAARANAAATAATTRANAAAATQAARQNAIALTANAQAATQAARQTMLLTQAQRNNAQAALANARAQQVATGANQAHGYSVATMAAHYVKFMGIHALMAGTFDAAKDGIVGYEQALKNLSTVLPKLHEDHTALDAAGQSLIKTMERYGVSLEEVSNTARSLGRLYKDVNTTLELTDQITLLNVIDNVSLDNATKGLETTLVSFGKNLKTRDEILSFSMATIDKITTLTHNAFAKGDDLVQILQRSASAAKQAGMSLNELLSIGTTALRSTGLPGGNIGNFIKTVTGTLANPNDSVISSLKGIGVEAHTAEGKLRPVYDIILDISKATGEAKYSQEELTEAIEQSSRGVFQWAKLAAVVGNYEEIIRTSALQLNAQGQTAAMAAQQLDTLARKAQTLKATMIDMWSGVGDNGLRESLKGIIDSLTQFIFGLKNTASTIVTVGGAYLGLSLIMKTVGGVYAMLTAAVRTATAASVAYSTYTAYQAGLLTAEAAAAYQAAAATNVFTAALARNPLGVVAIALSAVVAGIIAYTYASGEAEMSTIDLNAKMQDQAQIAMQQDSYNQERIQFLQKMAEEHRQLSQAVNSGTLSANEKAAAESKLSAVNQAMISVLDEEGKKHLEVAGITDQAISAEIEAFSARTEAERVAVQNTIRSQIAMSEAVKVGANERIQMLQQEGVALSNFANFQATVHRTSAGFLKGLASINDSVIDAIPGLPDWYKNNAKNNSNEIRKIAESHYNDIGNLQQQAIDNASAKFKKQISDAENNIKAANKSLMQVSMPSRISTDGINHAASGSSGSGGSGSKTPKESAADISDFTAPLREYANDAKFAMDPYNDILQLIDADLTAITTKERILDQQLQDSKIPTLDQLTQKTSLYSEIMQINSEKQIELHEAAEEAKKQLAILKEQMDAIIASHDAGEISTKEFNAAVSALRPEMQSLKTEIKGYSNAWWEAQYNQNAATQSLKEFYNTALKEDFSKLKDAYDERKKAIEAENEATEELIQSKEDLIDTLNEEADSRIKVLEAQIKALDEEADADSRADDEEEYNQKIKELTEERDKESLYAGKEHKERVAELNKEIAEAQKEWQEKQDDWKREDQKKALQDQIDVIEEEAKEKEDALRDEIDALKKQSDEKLKLLEKYWNQANELVSDKTLQAIANLAATKPEWYALGKELIEELIKGLESGDFSSVSDIMNMVNNPSSISSSQSSQSTSATAGMTWQEKLEYYADHETEALAEIARAAQVYAEAWAAGDVERARAAHKWADQIRKAIGVPMIWDPNTEASPEVHNSYAKGGPILYDQLAYVHAGEYVLKAKTVQDLGGTSSVERLVARIASTSLPTSQINNSNVQNSSSNDVTLNIHGPFYIRSDNDIKALGQEFHGVARAAYRGKGVRG